MIPRRAVNSGTRACAPRIVHCSRVLPRRIVAAASCRSRRSSPLSPPPLPPPSARILFRADRDRRPPHDSQNHAIRAHQSTLHPNATPFDRRGAASRRFGIFLARSGNDSREVLPGIISDAALFSSREPWHFATLRLYCFPGAAADRKERQCIVIRTL